MSLLSKVIYHISEQNSLGLPLFLTAKGIKASHALIDMLNLLPVDCDSKFKGDNLLFQFLSENYNQIYRYNMELSLKEKGTPFSKLIENLPYQLSVKKLYPLVELKNRTLYDLIPVRSKKNTCYKC